LQELEATQSQLLQAEKMASIGQLAAGVAHEINNPVGFVHSNLGTLQKYSTQLLALLDRSRAGQASEADFQQADYDYLKGDIRDLIAESQDGLQRVRKIVADLKDFSRIDHAEMVAADLNAGIKSTLNVVWNELKYKAEVVLELGDIPPVTCIAAQINQVLMNLLVNAAQAIGERGTITIRSGQGEHRVWIEVEDSGCGMPADVLAHIFEPFYTTKPVGKGTGLGLSLSYDIIHKHGGQIEVHSHPGQGSCFRIVLPVSPDAVG
jgi:two-component system NtrC family sensor kinase